MALPKELRKALQAMLKDGATLPDELDECVYFPNEGAALAFAEGKGKAKLKAAEESAAEAKQRSEQLEAQMADALKAIGVESVDKIDEFKTKWQAAQGTLTEADKVKVQLTAITKERDKLLKDNGDLSGFKVQVTKDKALSPHLAKIHPDLRDVVGENILVKLAIDDKGNVTAPEGKAIDAFVDELIKAKPSLKAPDYKGGAGTGQGGDKGAAASGGAAGGGNANGGGSNGTAKPKSIGEAVAQQLMAAEAAKAATMAGP